MSELRLEELVMPAASLGPPSPLVPFRVDTANLVSREMIDDDIADEEVRNIGYGYVDGCLPYTVQDGYDRDRRPRAFTSVVLENDSLRATFLPGLGGRLWSLLHKTQDRELLFVNPVFQPGNMGIRNAWFSGGVEWNFCWIGHTPLTCSPLFAGRAELDDGTPVLRLWEWERVRQMAYQIDCWLAKDLPVLFVRVRLVNPFDETVPVYWWSNIAVTETADTRVLGPTDSTYNFSYEGRFERRPFPNRRGSDRSFPLNSPHSGDYFFRIEDGHYPWVATANRDGLGFFHSSTSRLIGRKIWVFGTGAGGRRWQEFLNTPGHAYIEIQGGLTRIQSECIPMPARAEWDWVEAYGPLEMDGRVARGADWEAAWRGAEESIAATVSPLRIERERLQSQAMAERPPLEILHRGSGWGALEQARRRRAGEPQGWPRSLVFDEASLDGEQAPWLSLLNEGVLPETPPEDPPASYMTQRQWRQLLEKSAESGLGDHWLAWLHLGIMAVSEKRYEQAKRAWRESLARRPSAWAYRHLATLAAMLEDHAEAAELYPNAVRLAPGFARLVIECGKALVNSGQSAKWLELLEKLPPEARTTGRVRMLEARAALEVGDLGRVPGLLAEGLIVTDLREGETEPTRLWFAYHEQRLAAEEGVPDDDQLKQRVRREFPPPKHLDFRMH